jgi:hypothetical protein
MTTVAQDHIPGFQQKLDRATRPRQPIRAATSGTLVRSSFTGLLIATLQMPASRESQFLRRRAARPG